MDKAVDMVSAFTNITIYLLAMHNEVKLFKKKTAVSSLNMEKVDSQWNQGIKGNIGKYVAI